MGKKYFDTKKDTLESSILSVWQEAAKKNEDKLDPVNKNAVKKKFDDRKDKDIDNDGDVDSSDKFLHKRRKAVSKSIANEGKVVFDDHDADDTDFVKLIKKHGLKAKSDGDDTTVTGSPDKIEKVLQTIYGNDWKDMYTRKGQNFENFAVANEGLEDSPNPANSQHLCAKNVVHEEWGAGQPVRGMHDTPDADGNIAWYDVMFEHGIEKGVSINELKVTKSESHHHGEKKKDDEDKEMLKAKKEVKEYYEIGTDEYRDHTLDVTPGQDDPEWVAARDFKVQSMKEALAKVWGLDEKALDKSSEEGYDEEDEKLKPVKGSKTMTGGKVAKVEIQPKIDG